MNKYLVIIPARSGSKRIKDKNILKIGNKPLIAYTIEPAVSLKKEGLVSEVIFTTDSVKYAKIARNYGADIPFIRPKSISTDSSKSIEFILHAVNFLKKLNKNYDAVILLQPTSPLRNKQDIIESIRMFENNPKAESLISVYKEPDFNDLNIYFINGDYGIPLNPLHNAGIRRQNYKKITIRNGALYITKTKYLLKSKKIISDKPLIYVMPKNKSIDLDAKEDIKKISDIILKR